MPKMISSPTQKGSVVSRILNVANRDISTVPINIVFVGLLLLLVIIYATGFSINSGPSMNNLGLVYLTDWGSLPQVGQVFRFTTAENPSWYKYLPRKTQIKRCIGITKNERYIYEGDNREWSKDNRDNFEPVPASHVSGIITFAFHPRQITNWSEKTKEKKEMLKYSPNSVWSDDHEYFSLMSKENKNQLLVCIYSKNGEKIWEDNNFWLKASGIRPEWKEDHFVYPINEDWVYASFNPYTREYKTFVEKPSELTILYESEDKFILKGDCRSLIKVGDKFKQRRVVTVKYPWVDKEVSIPIAEQTNTLVLLNN